VCHFGVTNPSWGVDQTAFSQHPIFREISRWGQSLCLLPKLKNVVASLTFALLPESKAMKCSISSQTTNDIAGFFF